MNIVIASLTLGHLILDDMTVLVLSLATIAFFGSFIFISKTNDMKGALLSLLPGRKDLLLVDLLRTVGDK